MSDAEAPSPSSDPSRSSDPPEGSPSAAESICPNCGTPVTQKFCGECGQQVGVEGEGLGELILKESSGADRFGSLVTTLVWLFVRPGNLINEFLAGRRTRFVRPTQLYSAAAGSYLLCFALFQPLQIDLAEFEGSIRELEKAFPTIAERLEGRDIELVRDRFIDRLNLIFPIVALLTIPFYVLLFRLLFGPGWPRHTTTVIYFFAFAWLSGLLTMPLLKFAPITGTAVHLVILFSYWAAIQAKVYPGEEIAGGRRRFRFGAFLSVVGADLALNVLTGVVTGPAAMALCIASFR